jgi:hypothetical protein
MSQVNDSVNNLLIVTERFGYVEFELWPFFASESNLRRKILTDEFACDEKKGNHNDLLRTAFGNARDCILKTGRRKVEKADFDPLPFATALEALGVLEKRSLRSAQQRPMRKKYERCTLALHTLVIQSKSVFVGGFGGAW